jgi:hypothetical protein
MSSVFVLAALWRFAPLRAVILSRTRVFLSNPLRRTTVGALPFDRPWKSPGNAVERSLPRRAVLRSVAGRRRVIGVAAAGAMPRVLS